MIFSLTRNLFKVCASIALCLALSGKGAAQQSNYNLLWKISGKGLTKPSYLFGSMHIKDRRVFNFSDSVMKAMENTSAFVLETHPDSLMKAIYDVGLRSGKDSVEKVLTDAQKAEVLSRFERKNGYAPDSSVLGNRMLISSLMKTDYSKDDDMQTFVDAYLYGMARTFNKKIFGLESIKAQESKLYDSNEEITDLFEADVEGEKSFREDMVEVYVRGNIDEIFELIKEDYEDDPELMARNQVMANGMIELFKQHNLFVAVGVAHLPTESGIIALLRKAGYTVEPVKATFTGLAKKYTIDYAKMQWQNFTDSVNNYSVDFPAAPVRTTSKNLGGVVVFSDLINEAVYTVTSRFVGPASVIESRSVIDTLLNNHLAQQHLSLVSKKEQSNANGELSIEVEAKNKDKFVRMLLQYVNNTFYGLSVENSKNNLHDYYANRFFSSFKVNKQNSSATGWIDYKNDAGAFTVKLPSQPEEISREIPNPQMAKKPFKPVMYTVTDQSKLVSYIFWYNDYPEGMYMANSRLVFDNLAQQFGSKGEVIGTPRVIYKDGVEGRGVDIVVQDYYMEVEFYVRGNRSYMLLRQNLNADGAKAADDDFFKSFHFTPSKTATPKPFVVENVKLQMPGEAVEVKKDDEEDEATEGSYLRDNKSYYAVNRNTGGVYGLQTVSLSKYYRHKDLDSLYRTLLDYQKFESDSVYQTEEVLIGNIKGREYRAKDTLGGTERRSRLWVDQDKYFLQMVIVGKEEINSKTVEDYFKQVSYTPVARTFDLGQSKAKLIFDDLLSKDTTIAKDAFGALDYYEFEQKELPLIYGALKKSYPSDTLRNSVRARLLMTLPAIKDKTTLPFVKELFRANNPDIIKAKILAVAPLVDSTSYDWYLKNLIETPPLQIKDYWGLFAPLSDSLSYTSAHLNEILPLLDDQKYRTVVLNLLSDLVQDEKNKAAYLPLVANNAEKILAKANSDIDRYLAKPEEQPATVYAYLNILANLKATALTEAFTNKVFELDSVPYLHTEALATRIRTNLKLDEQLLSQKLDSLDSRYQVMQAFYLAGRLKEVPMKYRRHDEFARLKVYNYVSEDYAPDAINLLGSLNEDGEIYYAFEIVYTEDEEEKSYIAICGAFDNKSEDLQFNKYSCYWDYDQLEKDWQTQAKSLIELLKLEK